MKQVVWLVLAVSTEASGNGAGEGLPPQVWAAIIDLEAEAKKIAEKIRTQHPDWIVTVGPVKVAQSASEVKLPT